MSEASSSGSDGLTCAVVVTYHPDESVLENLRAMVRDCGRVLVVDNGSGADTRGKLAAALGVELLSLGENLGVAAALNRGLAWAEAQGCEWAVTFDQDSRPEPGLIAALLASARNAAVPGRVAVVGAHTYDERTGRRDRWLRPAWFGFRREYCGEADLPDATFVITSGALTRVRAWRELGGFDEGLFIDYVDHEFCLKARRNGWQVLVSAGARLAHNLGSKREVRLAGRTIRPTFHSAMRHYYMARNRLVMWRQYAWRYPHWWLFDLCFGGLNTLRVLLAEDGKWEKLKAMSRGSWDGLRGRQGRCPEPPSGTQRG